MKKYIALIVIALVVIVVSVSVILKYSKQTETETEAQDNQSFEVVIPPKQEDGSVTSYVLDENNNPVVEEDNK